MDQNQNIVLIQPGSIKGKTGELQSWISQFGQHFNLVLNRVLGNDQKIIQLADDQVKDLKELKDKSIVVFLLHELFIQDQGYLEFLNKISGSLGSPDTEFNESCLNAMKINLSGYEYKMLPEKIKFCMSYDMYMEGEQDGEIRLVSTTDKEYWPRLLDLVMDIRSVISKDTGTTRQAPIYIASPADDERQNWYRLRRELIGYGYKIFPDIDLHYPPADLKSYVQRCVDKSFLSIHILGNDYGKPYADTDKSLTELQFEYVTEYINTVHQDPDLEKQSHLQRIVWIQVRNGNVDEKQADLIDRVKRDIEKLHRTEIVQVPIELLKTLILNKLHESESKITEDAKVKKEGRKLVYLIHEKSDDEAVRALESRIQADGWETTRIPFGKDQENLLGLHKACLKECDGAVINYSGSSRSWLISKIRDLQKAPGLGRSNPMLVQGVVIRGKDRAEDVAFPPGMVIIRDKDPEKHLDPILVKLKESK